ncbi:MAG: carboxymuconolactone decarboxylase family protein [Proteobacteria bacterium]|nr:carboxymuconolactone decarboxylase family protein [Pseudomonadota bacterium]
MKARLNAFSASPAAMKVMMDFSTAVTALDIEHSLQELVKIRASQINGCGFCLHMHTRDALKQGESAERIFLLDGWRESPLYTERERAALAWTEALTRLPGTVVSDDVYEQVKAHFTPDEQVKLTVIIGAINTWNRINVGFQVPHPVSRAAA